MVENIGTSGDGTRGDFADHSTLKTIILSLLPGLLVLAFFLVFAPIAYRYSIPVLSVIIVAIPLVLIPFELGYLYVQGKKLNGRYSLKGIVLFREKIPQLRFILLFLAAFLWTIFCFGFLSGKIDPPVTKAFFGWLPNWFFVQTPARSAGGQGRTLLVVTAVLTILFNGIAGPIVEEMYFRGYLLPRMRYMRGWAPLVNAVLFSLYHFFSPWQNITRILALVPYVYIVWWKRNLKFGIAVHCSLNLVGSILSIVAAFG